MYSQFIEIFIFGLVIGSFLGMLSYRWPRNLKFIKGRSFCDRCGKKISWYDNIPLLSFILLNGKCRFCHQKISFRYPLIELSTAILFLIVLLFINKCDLYSMSGYPLCIWKSNLNIWSLPFFLFVVIILITIFVTDFENQLIPDNIVFLLLSFTIFVLIFSSNRNFYQIMLSGFLVSLVFLLLNIITKGRGMGLGDVKLVLPLGIILGWPSIHIWIFLSFIIGAVVGIILMFMGKTKFKQQIAFGPFLIISFFIVLFWGEKLRQVFMPYL